MPSGHATRLLHTARGWYARRGKRVVDVAAASVALVALGPVLASVAAAVRWNLGRPVLFRQTRAGLHGEPFTIIKFRTMTDERDATGQLLPDAQRLPSFGKTLRATSLDELPELINVLRGDMSLVGPRPLPQHYLDRYSDRQAQRHDVRPGLTGFAQIRGRNHVDWANRLEFDVQYVEQLSLGLDLWILMRTVALVLGQTGVAPEGQSTMPEFQGEQLPGNPLPPHPRAAQSH